MILKYSTVFTEPDMQVSVVSEKIGAEHCACD